MSHLTTFHAAQFLCCLFLAYLLPPNFLPAPDAGQNTVLAPHFGFDCPSVSVYSSLLLLSLAPPVACALHTLSPSRASANAAVALHDSPATVLQF